jgi:hypothetical protein
LIFIEKIFSMAERSISSVPKPVLFALTAAFCAQVIWQTGQSAQQSNVENLPAPPSTATLKMASFGDPIVLAKLSMLYVQAFDNRPGRNTSLHQLDYPQLETWLTRIVELDPQAQYPLFAASQLYGEINDEGKQRRILEFVYRQFLIDPNRRWRSLAHAATLARHRLKDMPLAQKYARALRLHISSKEVPSWATQMEIFLLEDLDELTQAKILLGGLLQSGQINDPYEFKFLEQRLIALEEKTKMKANKQR